MALNGGNGLHVNVMDRSSKIAIYLSLGLHKGCPSYRRSLQPSKEKIQHCKKWNLLTVLNFCRSFFAVLNPDPQHWFVGIFFIVLLFSQSRCPDCKQLIPDFVMDEHVEDCPGRWAQPWSVRYRILFKNSTCCPSPSSSLVLFGSRFAMYPQIPHWFWSAASGSALVCRSGSGFMWAKMSRKRKSVTFKCCVFSFESWRLLL